MCVTILLPETNILILVLLSKIFNIINCLIISVIIDFYEKKEKEPVNCVIVFTFT